MLEETDRLILISSLNPSATFYLTTEVGLYLMLITILRISLEDNSQVYLLSSRRCFRSRI